MGKTRRELPGYISGCVKEGTLSKEDGKRAARDGGGHLDYLREKDIKGSGKNECNQGVSGKLKQEIQRSTHRRSRREIRSSLRGNIMNKY